jgi:hypothetical protein
MTGSGSVSDARQRRERFVVNFEQAAAGFRAQVFTPISHAAAPYFPRVLAVVDGTKQTGNFRRTLCRGGFHRAHVGEGSIRDRKLKPFLIKINSEEKQYVGKCRFCILPEIFILHQFCRLRLFGANVRNEVVVPDNARQSICRVFRKTIRIAVEASPGCPVNLVCRMRRSYPGNRGSGRSHPCCRKRAASPQRRRATANGNQEAHRYARWSRSSES